MKKKNLMQLKLSRFFHFPRTPLLTCLLIIHTYFLFEYYLEFEFSNFVTHPWFELTLSLYSYFTLSILYYLIETMSTHSRLLKYGAMMTLLTGYALACSYFFGSNLIPEFSIIYDTMSDATTWGAFDVILSRLDYEPFMYLAFVIILFCIQEIRRGWLSQHRVVLKQRWVQVGLLLTIYSICIASPIKTIDLVTYFFQSSYHYFFSSTNYDKLLTTPYPYLKESFAYTNAQSQEQRRPHIFLIVIESFNQASVTMKNDQNKPIMPFFNQLIKKGLYVSHYYSPSVLSVKGYGSLMFGLPPLYRGLLLKKIEKSDSITYNLPQLLAKNNYITNAFTSDVGHHEEMKTMGFHDIQKLSSVTTKKDKAFWTASWGYEDRVLYKHFFHYLDNKQKENSLNQPFFNTLITLYNHTGFSVPIPRRHHYPSPNTLEEKFKNSISLSDEGLRLFFQELNKRDYLKNSLVIITGDHGYPLGNHGITKTETGIYNESYRVPFLMVWPNQLEPHVITPETGVYSHVDMIPTIIDLLRLNVTSHTFIGDSILAKKTKPTLLVQPYGGIHLQLIQYPYKYRKHLSLNQEYVYDLQRDPLETQSILSSVDSTVLAQFRTDLNAVFLNQYLVDTKRIFPPAL